jgi:hypothetical protein
MFGIVILWSDLWVWAEKSQLGTSVVGGLIVALFVAVTAAILSALRTTWWTKIRGNLVRTVRWLFSVRVVTAAGLKETYERGLAEGSRALRRHTELDRADSAVADTKLASTSGDSVSPQITFHAIPSPLPRWSMWSANPQGDHREFVLRNTVARSHAREVRLESSTGRFKFLDGAHWESLMGGHQAEFRGEMDDWGWEHGLTFEIRWYDELGISHEVSVAMPAPAKEDYF